MINLQLGINTVVLTLSELVTISNPKFLFEFYSDQTKAYTYFIASDISAYTQRYNEFLITVVDTQAQESPTTGTIYLPNKGQYKYKVYQQTSSSNLDPDNSDGVVEEGRVNYEYDDATITAHNPNLQTKVYGE